MSLIFRYPADELVRDLQTSIGTFGHKQPTNYRRKQTQLDLKLQFGKQCNLRQNL